MALQKFANLTQFWNNKSIKLSDAFDVLVKYAYYDKNGKEVSYTRLVSCTGFTIPKLEYEEETYEYGNVAQIFLTPKYDSCKELTLEFIERMEKQNNTHNHSVTLNKIMSLMGYKLNQKFSQGLMTNQAEYDIDSGIPELLIKIMNNKLWRYKYQYHFNNLKIVNYTTYNLDYQSDSPCKVSVTLSFESYKKEIIDEPVWDDEQKQVEKPEPKESPKQTRKEKYDPNGDVSVTELSVDGKNYSNKEDIEINWKNSINQDDLQTINNEPLLNPLFDLPDLEDETTPDVQTVIYKQNINDDDLASLRERPELAELKDLEMDETISNPPIANQPTKYQGLTAKEWGQAAAQSEDPKTSYKIALNAVGLDAKARKEVEESFKKYNKG